MWRNDNWIEVKMSHQESHKQDEENEPECTDKRELDNSGECENKDDLINIGIPENIFDRINLMYERAMVQTMLT